MSVTARRVSPKVGSAETARVQGGAGADYAFEIWGGTTVETIDITAVFAAASVRMGEGVWVGSVASKGQWASWVRLSRSPVQSAGDNVDAAFILDAQPHSPTFNGPVVGNGPDAADTIRAVAEVYVDHRVGRLLWKRLITGNSVRPLPLTALASRISGVSDGHRLVALGMLAWMYGRDPDLVRRLLENGLAPRGGRMVSAALRLFEIGWREAPRWVRRRAAAHSAHGPKTDAPTGARPGRVVMDGLRALVTGARTAGVRRCYAPSFHPVVDDIGRAFAATDGQPVHPCGPSSFDHVSSESGPILFVEPPGGGDPGDVQYPHELLSDRIGVTASGGNAAPRVIVRLERLVPADVPLWPNWLDPLAVRIGCAAEDVPGYAATFISTSGAEQGAASSTGESRVNVSGDTETCERGPVVLVPTNVEECFRYMSIAAAIAREHTRDTVLLVDALLLGAVEAIDARGVGKSSTSGPMASPLAAMPAEADVVGGNGGDVLLLGWGATRGPVEEAVARLRARGLPVSSLHLRTLNPLPTGLLKMLARFRRIVLIDIDTDGYGSARRVRHLMASLRARAAAAARRALAASSAPATAGWLVKRLSTHVFAGPRPLGPNAVCDFVLTVVDAE